MWQGFDYRRSRDSPPGAGGGAAAASYAPEPAPAPRGPVEWPSELEFMPASEKAEFRTDVAAVARLHPEGSAAMVDERRRLERTFCVDPEVLDEVFLFVNQHGAA